MVLASERWRAHATYDGGYDEAPPPVRQGSTKSLCFASSPTAKRQIEWLWAFIDEASPETRARLLRFITGSLHLPAPVSVLRFPPLHA